VLAAGGCVVRWRGADHTVVRPELIGPAEARAWFGPVTWRVAERRIGADAFLLLHRSR
jgi:hypothetical protein